MTRKLTAALVLIAGMRQVLGKRLFLRAGLMALALQCSGTAYASSILWNNGGPAIVNEGGSLMSDTIQAQDFQLSSLSNLTSIQFWNLQGVAGDYLGSIYYQITTDAAGSPSTTIIASGQVSPTRVAAGNVLGYDRFQNDFNVSVNNVAPGTYWLALHNGPLSSTAFNDFYWTWADLNAVNTATNRGQEFGLNPLAANWTTNDQEHAFNVTGETDAPGTPVPEPATLLLIAGGLAALARRGQRRAQD